MFKQIDLGQILQVLMLLSTGASAWYSLSTDMALIKQRLEIDTAAAVKTDSRISNLEERVTNVENTQRDIWHDVRGRSGQR